MLNHLIIAALAAATLPGAVLANEPTADIAVHYGDLDLTRPGDVKRLDRRIAAAISEVCGEDVTNSDLDLRRIVAQCKADKQQQIADLRAVALDTAHLARHAQAAAR